MGSTLSVAKTLVIPAVISLILFLLSTFLLVPLWRRYRARYSQYLPLPLGTISSRTSSLRGRLQDALAALVVPAQWRAGGSGSGSGSSRLATAAADGSDLGYSSEEGEELDDVYEGGVDRRHALSLDARSVHTDSIRRLSRDLEEGFRDDSEEDDDDTLNRRR